MKLTRDDYEFNNTQICHIMPKHIELDRALINLYMLLKYEDLVNDPKRYLEQILKKVNCEFEDNQLTFYKFVHHNIDGNRMKRDKDQQIVQDKKYLYELSRSEWLMGTIISSISLKIFGYKFRKPVEKH